MRSIILAITIISIFAGCSAKEFNEGVESISNDISNAFEAGKDKSAD